MLPGALEHHVFKHVRDAGYTTIFITRTDLVPDLSHGDRGAVVFLNQDLQSVLEFELVNIRLTGKQGERRGGQQQRTAVQQHGTVSRGLVKNGREHGRMFLPIKVLYPMSVWSDGDR